MNKTPTDFPEVIARLVDSSEDGNMENPLTAGLVEALSKCDLIIGGVLNHITDESTTHDDAFWWGCYARVGEHPTGPTQIGDAQRMLAEVFGGVHIEGLQERLNAALWSRQEADKRQQAAWEAEFNAENARREAEERERRLIFTLARVLRRARSVRDENGDPLSASIVSLIADSGDLWYAIDNAAKELEARERSEVGLA